MTEPNSANPIAFAPRRVIDLGMAQGSWTAKVYAILSERWSEDDLPTGESRAAILRQSMGEVGGPLDHPYGFAIIHMANDGIFLLLTRFNNANNLRHQVFALTPDPATWTIAPLEDPHIIACVWELRLMMFEADAWIDTVLQHGLTHEATQDYLARRYQGMV